MPIAPSTRIAESHLVRIADTPLRQLNKPEKRGRNAPDA